MLKSAPLDKPDAPDAAAAVGPGARLKTLIHTDKPDEAEEFLSGLYGQHAMEASPRHNLDLRMHGFDFEQLHVGVVQYGSPVIARLEAQRPMWVFSYLRRGTVTRGGVEFGPGDAGVNSPDDMRDLIMSSDMEIVNLRILQGDMNDACRAMLGSDLSHPLSFETSCPAGASSAYTLMRLIDRFAAVPLYQHAAARQLERNLKSAALLELLLAWPNSYTTCLDDQPALPMSTQRARDYIHAHAAELPTVAEIAQACNVGVRALSRGFEKHLKTSPQRYMMEHRLDKVRDEILNRRDIATVTEVAFDWGFMHLGIFAARYRERFGELPSETLRRARR